ncbi:Transcription factor 25 [Trichuris trichiura]|uniref:Transcription factor 25 n=1 Tax=Trichuris trichiura TaxID=36087 RepID=A0A077Z557_TRITR|nr:Transcription factor 25 [Trichuris trichiura]
MSSLAPLGEKRDDASLHTDNGNNLVGLGDQPDENAKEKNSSDSDLEIVSSKFSLLCHSESADADILGDSVDTKADASIVKHSEGPKIKGKNKKSDNARKEVPKQGKKQTRQIEETRDEGSVAKAALADDIYRVMYRFLRPQEEIDNMYRLGGLDDRKRHSLRKRGVQTFGIVARKPTWPTYRTTGLYMEQVPSKCGLKQFAFKYNKAYSRKESEFLTYIRSPNLRSLTVFLRKHPYHVNSMIQCSEMLYWRDDLNTAQDLNEMAIYSLECSFHSCFTITGGDCRLDYNSYENRQGYLHRALHGSDTLLAKRLPQISFGVLQVDPLVNLDKVDDPLAMVLIIDYLYLLNEMYDTVIELEKQFDTDRCLDLLPNIKYSVALACFMKASASGDDRDLQKADEKLYAALMQFPTMVPALLNKLQVIPEGNMLQCPYFGAAEQLSDGKGLQILIDIYAQRTWKLWNKDDVLAWLKAGIDRFASKFRESPPEMLATLEIHAAVRKAQYFRCPRPVYRHIFLSKNLDIPLPSESVYTFNPFPPDEEDERLKMQNSGQNLVPRSWMFINLDLTMDALLGRTLLASRQLFELIGSVSSRGKKRANTSNNNNNNSN